MKMRCPGADVGVLMIRVRFGVDLTLMANCCMG